MTKANSRFHDHFEEAADGEKVLECKINLLCIVYIRSFKV
jgi:hypothetical protein